MKFPFFILVFFCVAKNAMGQLSGKITSAARQPIPSVNVLLLHVQDSSLVKAALSDKEGLWKIENIIPGSYILRISSVGYQPFDSVFELAAGDTSRDFGTFSMNENVKQLAEVVVRAEKPLFQQQIDGTVVNVESSILTKGSSALEILERSPGVIVDHHNNNIALNGKFGVTIMINGKLVNMPLDQVVSLLNGMSADNIEKIELLTTPPAKYDAEGSAGMINIVMKKTRKKGTSGSIALTGGYGWGEKASGSLSLSHNTKNMNLSGNYSFNHDRGYGEFKGLGSENIPVLGGQTDFDFRSTVKPIQTSQNATVGLDLKFNEKTTVGGSVNYNVSRASTDAFNHGNYTVKQDSSLILSVDVNGHNKWKNLIGSVYVEHKMREGEQINFDVDYLYYRNDNPADVQGSFLNKSGSAVSLNNDTVFSPNQRGLANTTIKVGVFKMDYARSFSKKVKLEAGLKETHTGSSSFSGIESQVNGQWVSRTGTSNNIKMHEGIEAGYASFNFQFDPSTKLVLGGRYEYSDTHIDNIDTMSNSLDRRLGKLFPNLFFSRKLSDNSEFQMSFTQRINRPTYNDLASFVSYNDPISVFTGNPLLRATITSNLKFGYNYRNYSFSVLLSRDKDPIAQAQIQTGPSKDLLYITPQNLEYQNNLTFQTILPFKIGDWWNMTYGFVGGWRQFKESYTAQPVEKTYFGYSLNFSESFKLPKNLSMELSGWYNGPSYYGTIYVEGMGSVNAGIKKELPRDHGSLQVSVTDIFRTMVIVNNFGSLTSEYFALQSHSNIYTESSKATVVKVTYFRSFGNSARKVQRSQNSGSPQEEIDRVRKN